MSPSSRAPDSHIASVISNFAVPLSTLKGEIESSLEQLLAALKKKISPNDASRKQRAEDIGKRNNAQRKGWREEAQALAQQKPMDTRWVAHEVSQVLPADAMVVEDTGAVLKFLQGAEPVKPDAVGSIGYCMGGRHVLAAAVRYPEHFKASASLHGTDLISERPESPHLHVARLRGELYCGFAELDPYAPLPMVRQLDELLKPCPVRYGFEVHKGAEHGYALPDRDIFDKKAAERDWELIFAMFHRQIPPYAP